MLVYRCFVYGCVALRWFSLTSLSRFEKLKKAFSVGKISSEVSHLQGLRYTNPQILLILRPLRSCT